MRDEGAKEISQEGRGNLGVIQTQKRENWNNETRSEKEGFHSEIKRNFKKRGSIIGTKERSRVKNGPEKLQRSRDLAR